jgi:hypothetical protein
MSRATMETSNNASENRKFWFLVLLLKITCYGSTNSEILHITLVINQTYFKNAHSYLKILTLFCIFAFPFNFKVSI